MIIHVKLSFISLISCCLIICTTAIGYSADKNIGYILADDEGTILSHQNETCFFVPASILKILTSLSALHILKADYRFQTQYHFDPVSKDLYIKGFGDPLLISEVIEQLCSEIISNIKMTQIRNIVCDTSYFSSEITIPGKGLSLNPYDSPVGALCANFNTINFKWNPKTNRFISAEPQTPLLKKFQHKIKQTRLKAGRIVLTREENFLYPGWLIQYFLKKKIKITGAVMAGQLPLNHQNTETFRSPYSVSDLVQKLLKYSNNFIANQLLLSAGAVRYGSPATLEKGILAIKLYAKTHLELTDLPIFEGSGLSRENKITPVQMLTILQGFEPYYFLLKQKRNDYYKTGTLHGVRTRAGFLIGKNRRRYPYVIMVNQHNKTYDHIYNKFVKKIARIDEISN